MTPDQLGALLLFWILFAIAFTLIPWFVAVSRGSRNSAAIFVLCLFFGWSVIGWVAAFIWAMVDERKREPRRRRRSSSRLARRGK